MAMAFTQQPFTTMLSRAQKGGYAIGAFNCRYRQMIPAVLAAAREARSPVAIEIAQLEIDQFALDLNDFMETIKRSAHDLTLDVPVAVHLDHSWDDAVIDAAIRAGFTSVMIDASAKPLAENIARTREIVDRAHAAGVGVEAELGRIASADKLETTGDSTLYTDPEEARSFVAGSGCDFLAVSVGSAHGVYAVKNPTIDYERLREIRAVTSIPLVLHGGTGLPAETVRRAIAVPGGGISKLNVATELELALLEAIGAKERLSPAEINALSPGEEKKIHAALRKIVMEKMRSFLLSADRA